MANLKMYIDKVKSRTYLQKERNSITVDDVTIDFPLVFDGNGKMYFFKLDRYVYVKGTRYTKADGKTRDFLMTCLFKRGFMSDGASAPSFAQFVVPDIKAGNDVYNSAPFIHDGLYMCKGTIEGADLTREECDDVLRGIWRIAGMSRLVAGAADLGIYIFAGASDHWGNDSNNCKHLFKAKFEYR
jgi:hypothetical protein